MVTRKIAAALILACTVGAVHAQDPNIMIGLNPPAYGVKIKNNFPGETRGFARAFTLSNQDATVDYIGLGAYGTVANGVNTLTYGYLGPSYDKAFMVFLPNNNVGIGTATPSSPLEIQGASGTSTVSIRSTAGLATENSGILFQSGKSFVGYDGTFGGLRIAGSDATKPIIFGNALAAGTGEMMRLTGSGLLGIGKNTPVSKIHAYENNTGTGNSNGITIEQGGTGDAVQHFLLTGSQRWTIGIDNSDASSFKIGTNADLGAENMFTIQKTGNVGIGTTDPKGYKLAVNGKIRAQEIKVETANWPDYVFEKEYQLPTLDETESHIKEKGHLPGIPSAAEVKAKGIDVGEMNAKLLQKIEELTLHMIEMKKKSMNQEQKIEKQQKLIDQLISKNK